jgi:tubulin polyglutamylase complex subunit 2
MSAECSLNVLRCVALVYISGSEAPEVWFQELSCVWSVLAQSFSDYFRLMLAHVGLPAWQSAFTPTGLVPSVRAWLRLLSPGTIKKAVQDQT